MTPPSTQLQIGPTDVLQALAVDIHRDFLSLGLFDAYGDMCLVMALALTKVLAHHRIAAQVHFCNLVIAREQGAYLLGFEDPTAKIPSELIDTHAVCVADGRLLLDFGLGQVRKAWQVPVYDSAMATFTPHSEVMATHFVDHCAYVWLHQPRHNPRVRAAIEGNQALAQTIFERWRSALNAPRATRTRHPAALGLEPADQAL
jgi:hypothetical protein